MATSHKLTCDSAQNHQLRVILSSSVGYLLGDFWRTTAGFLSPAPVTAAIHGPRWIRELSLALRCAKNKEPRRDGPRKSGGDADILLTLLPGADLQMGTLRGICLGSSLRYDGDSEDLIAMASC